MSEAAATRRWLTLGLGVAALVLAVDQASKWWIVDWVMNPPQTVVLTPFLNLVMAWNRGVSFGLLASDSLWSTWGLSLLAVVVVGFLLVWLRRAGRNWVAVAIGMIVGGALGNVIDRLRFGAVADFIDFHLLGWHFYTFNVADSGISVGAALLVLDSLFQSPKSPK